MREEEFRRRLQGAIGEPPPLAPPMFTGSPALARRLYPRAMGLLAIAVAVLLILVLVGSRLALQPRGYIQPAATSKAVAQLPPDSMPCHLAVNMVQDAGNPGGVASVLTSTMGFVNVPDGSFEADPGAKVADLPHGSTTPPESYSGALHRWLPAGTRQVSPDGRSYAYSTGSELHVVDAARHTDRKLWMHAPDIEVWAWRADGILVTTVPQGGGIQLTWRVDPTSGTATQDASNSAPFTLSPNLLPPGSRSYSYEGGDAIGRGVYRIGGRDPGTHYTVILVFNGSVTTIHSGVQGDAFDFDPDGVYFDAHGLWMGNYDGKYVWLWSESAGLHAFSVSGLAAAPAGYEYFYQSFIPAGPCVPGVFRGTAAPPLPPAATPSPPPNVDWAPLLAKPVKTPTLLPGSKCPVTPSVTINGRTNGPKTGVPNYGYGQSPVYLSGQVNWYAGSQGLLVLTDPSYSGPVLIRSARLDGSGSLVISASAGSWLQNAASGAVGIPQTSSPPYWAVWFGVVTISAPGCYGIQLDGTSFSEVVVIEVRQGPPPPG